MIVHSYDMDEQYDGDHRVNNLQLAGGYSLRKCLTRIFHKTGVLVPRQVNSRFSGYIYLAVAAIIWGSNGVIVNRIPYNAYTITFFRVLFGSITLLPLVLINRKTELTSAARSWKTMLDLGFFTYPGLGIASSLNEVHCNCQCGYAQYLTPHNASCVIISENTT